MSSGIQSLWARVCLNGWVCAGGWVCFKCFKCTGCQLKMCLFVCLVCLHLVTYFRLVMVIRFLLRNRLPLRYQSIHGMGFPSALQDNVMFVLTRMSKRSVDT